MFGDVYLPSATSSGSSGSGCFSFLANQSTRLCHLFRQNVIPDVVFRDPIRKKNGTQTTAMTIAKSLKFCSCGMLVMPNTDVTNVKGRKKMETYFFISLITFEIKNVLTSVNSLML